MFLMLQSAADDPFHFKSQAIGNLSNSVVEHCNHDLIFNLYVKS